MGVINCYLLRVIDSYLLRVIACYLLLFALRA